MVIQFNHQVKTDVSEAIFGAMRLDHFMLFSSVAALLGSPGLGVPRVDEFPLPYVSSQEGKVFLRMFMVNT